MLSRACGNPVDSELGSYTLYMCDMIQTANSFDSCTNVDVIDSKPTPGSHTQKSLIFASLADPLQCFWPSLTTNVGSCSHGKSMFSQFQEENSQLKEQKKLSTFCAILTALFHSSFYFYIPNVEILVNQIFDFFVLFDHIIVCEFFFKICIKQFKKFLVLGCQVAFPKWGVKNPALFHFTF